MKGFQAANNIRNLVSCVIHFMWFLLGLCINMPWCITYLTLRSDMMQPVCLLMFLSGGISFWHGVWVHSIALGFNIRKKHTARWKKAKFKQLSGTEPAFNLQESHLSSRALSLKLSIHLQKAEKNPQTAPLCSFLAKSNKVFSGWIDRHTVPAGQPSEITLHCPLKRTTCQTPQHMSSLGGGNQAAPNQLINCHHLLVNIIRKECIYPHLLS